MPFVGIAMSRFDPASEYAKIVHAHGGWQLRPGLIKYWHDTEIVMLAASKALSGCILSQAPYLEGLWDVPPKPSSYRFRESQKELGKARRAAEQSAYSFAIHGGYISFLLALFRVVVGPPSIKTRDIYQQLGLASSLSSLEKLFFSGVGNTDPSFSRRGLIVAAQGCPWINLIPWIVESNIPVWIHWGTPPFFAVSEQSWLALYRPTQASTSSSQDFSASWEGVPAANNQPNHSKTMVPEASSAENPDVNPDFPAVVADSGQKPGETMKAFFQRRMKKNLRFIEKETPADTERRLRRVAEKEKNGPPGKKGPQTFYWEKRKGYRIRTFFPRSEARDLWDILEHIYDPWCDSWDLCSDFEEEGVEVVGSIIPVREQSPLFDDAGKVIPGTPTEDDALASPTMMRPLTHPRISSHHPASPPNTAAKECTVPLPPLPMPPTSGPSAPSNTHRMPALETRTTREFMYYKYGCTSHMSSTTLLPPHVQGELLVLPKLDVAFQLVGAESLTRELGDDVSLLDFLVMVFHCKTRPATEIIPTLWDFRPQNDVALHLVPSLFCIQPFDTPSKVTLCILRPKSDETEGSWLVAVSPRIALECIRRGLGPTNVDVATYLLSNGIPFSTLLPAPSLNPSKILQPKPSEPVVQGEPSDTGSDYGAYVKNRDLHLRSISRGRRALSMGGILRRLAMECLPDSDVLAGPSQDALEGNGEVYIIDGNVMVDDGLSVQDLDIISGVCVSVLKGPGSTSSPSWFPRERLWNDSGFNKGFWDPAAEAWYRRRCSELSTGEASKVLTSDWKCRILGTERTHDFLTLMDKHCLAYLKSSDAAPLLYLP
ncbi:hypothetical protein NLJ89_g10122 [Agrocybe chaxingu]|uniref:Uncharacterized protein n=1 Tax=Agrocybe chaxingu TaxID=84603 RepID=A0A9W8JSB6_9AGAR|nr:hypothetical protein NLJ89_g10122 [Agrocybe chaxingu]